MGMKW